MAVVRDADEFMVQHYGIKSQKKQQIFLWAVFCRRRTEPLYIPCGTYGLCGIRRNLLTVPPHIHCS